MGINSINGSIPFNNKIYNEIKDNNIQHQGLAAATQPTEKKHVKAGSTIGAALGVATTTALIAKKQGYSLLPKNIIKTNWKDMALFNIKEHSKVEYETGEILALGGSSVVGGFIGGAVTDDKKNLKAKARESLNQLVGNILIPICAIGGTKLVYSDLNIIKGKSIQKTVENILPQINGSSKFVKGVNGAIKAIPTLGITIASLVTGIVTGNKVSNLINEKIYKKEIDRNIKPSDFAPHLDDVCLASSIMAPKSHFFAAISRFVPAVLVVPGYQTGTASEKA